MADGTLVKGLGKCTCDDPFLDELVGGIVKEALPAIGEIACKSWFTSIDVVINVGVSAIPGLAGVVATGVVLAYQVAEYLVWAIDDEKKRQEAYRQFLNDPNNAEATPEAGRTIMDRVCGNEYTPDEAQKIFNTFQFAAGFAGVPRLLTAAKGAVPSIPKGKATPKEANDAIKELRGGNKKPKDEDRATTAPKPTTEPRPTTEPTQKPTTEQNHCTRRNGKRAPKGNNKGKFMLPATIPRREPTS